MATILVVESRELYIQFKERFSPKRQRVSYASTVGEARELFTTYEPWLVVVPVESAGADLLVLLQEARRLETKILGLTRGDRPVAVRWAHRTAPEQDFDQVARAATTLFLESVRSEVQQDPLAPDSDLDRTARVERIEPEADAVTEESTLVDQQIISDMTLEPEVTEVTRRNETPAVRFADMLAEERPGQPVYESIEVEDQPAAEEPAVEEHIEEQVGGDLYELQERFSMLDQQLETLQDLQRQTEQAQQDLGQVVQSVQRAGADLQGQMTRHGASVAALDQRIEALQDPRPQAFEEVRRELEQTREDREQVQIRLAQTQKELKRTLQTHQELQQQVSTLGQQLEDTSGVRGEVDRLTSEIAGLTEQLESLSREPTEVTSLSQRLEALVEEPALDQLREDQDQARQDRDRLRNRLAQTRRELTRSQQSHAELTQSFAKVQETGTKLQELVESQAAQIVGLSRQLDALVPDPVTTPDLEKALVQVEGKVQPLGEQLESARNSMVALQGRLEESTRLHNALHVRVNRLSMDVSEWRQELRHQIDQHEEKSQQANTVLADRLDGYGTTLTTLEQSKAATAELAQIRQEMDDARSALEQADQLQLRKLDQAWKGRVELDQKIEAQTESVAMLKRGQATVAEIEKGVKTLSKTDRVLEQADQELAKSFNQGLAQLRRELERTKQAGIELKGRIDGQGAALVALEQDRAASSELQQTREDLVRTREALERADQELIARLDQARAQLDQQLELARQAHGELVDRAEAQAGALVAVGQEKVGWAELERTRKDLTGTREALEQADQGILRKLDQAWKARADLDRRIEEHTASMAALAEEKAASAELLQTRAELTATREALEQANLEILGKLDQAWKARAELDRRLKSQVTAVELLEEDKAGREELEQARLELTQARQAAEEVHGDLAERQRLAREHTDQRLAQVRQSHQVVAERVDAQAESLAMLGETQSTTAVELEQTQERLTQLHQASERVDSELSAGLQQALEQLDQRRQDQLELVEQLGSLATALDAAATEREQTRDDLVAAREALQGKLDQATRARAGLDGRLEDHAGTLARLEADKAAGADLEQTRQDLTKAREALEQIDQEILRKLDQAWKARSELDKRISAQAKTLAQLETDKAVASDLEETRTELTAAQGALEQADQELADGLKLQRERLDQQLDRAAKARSELRGRIDGHSASIAQLGQQKAAAADLDQTRQELATTREALEQADQAQQKIVEEHRAALDKELAEARKNLEQADKDLTAALNSSTARLDKKLGEVKEQAAQQLDKAREELVQELDKARLARAELKGVDDVQAVAIATLKQEKATVVELDKARQAFEQADQKLGGRLDEARRALDQQLTAGHKARTELSERLDATRLELEQEVEEAQQGRAVLRDRIDGHTALLTDLDRDKATVTDLHQTRDDLIEAREALEQTNRQLAQKLHQTRESLEGRLDQIRIELTESNESLGRTFNTRLDQHRRRADEQGLLIGSLSERVDVLSRREPQALRLVLFVVFPLLAVIVIGGGIGLYFALRSPKAPPPPPPSKAKAPAVTPKPAAAVVPPGAKPKPKPDAAPAPPAVTAKPPTAETALPPHVVEPDPDPAWSGALSRRKRRAMRRLRTRRLRLAGRLMRRRDQTRAKKVLTRVLAMTDDVQVRQLLALSHQKAGEYEAAHHHLKKALAKAPPARYLPLLNDRLGLVLIRLKQKEQACAAFRKASRLRPRLPRARQHLRKYCR